MNQSNSLMSGLSADSIAKTYTLSTDSRAKTDPESWFKQSYIVLQSSSSTKDFNIKGDRLIHLGDSENSTNRHEYIQGKSDDICLEIQEIFESDIEKEFSQKLFFCIQKYGNAAIEIITCLILYNTEISRRVGYEALHLLGSIDHLASYQFRVWLLEQSLSSPTVSVQNGAILGLYNINKISKLYTVVNEEKVIDFIIQHPKIISLLVEANKEIRKYFLREKLSLEVSSEYNDTKWEKLALSIWTSVDHSDDAFGKLSHLDESWWLEVSSGVGINLYIGLEFE